MTPTSNHDPAALACPSCSSHNEEGLCGIKLMNPVGCDEVVIVVKCVGCGRLYLEEEEDGEAHKDGPVYRTSGPYEEAVGYELVERISACPEPWLRLCQCPSHKFMDDFMYGDFYRGMAEARARAGSSEAPPDADSAASVGAAEAPPRRLVSPPLDAGQQREKVTNRQSRDSRSELPLTPKEERITADMNDVVTHLGGEFQVFKKGMGWARRKLGQEPEPSAEEKRFWDTYPAEKRDYEAFVADILRSAGDEVAPPIAITNGVVDWSSSDESSEVLQGVAAGGWIDPDCQRIGSVSRELNSTREVIQTTPFHVQRDHRELSFVTLDSPTVEADKPAMESAFRKGVITPLIEMNSSPDDNLYGWLDVMFAFCSGKPLVYYSHYVPSDEVHAVAQRHGVRVVHRPLRSIPKPLLSRHGSFQLLRLTAAQWEELENENGGRLRSEKGDLRGRELGNGTQE